jgi:hypothetical protein
LNVAEACEFLDRRAPTRVLVGVDADRLPSLLWNLDGHDLVGEEAARDRAFGTPLALGGEAVLVLPRDPESLGNRLCRDAHVTALDRAGEPLRQQ